MQLHDMLHRVRTLMQDHSASPHKSIPDQPENPLLLNRRIESLVGQKEPLCWYENPIHS